MIMKIDHVALWAKDMDKIINFYVKYFSAEPGEVCHNPVKRLTTCFVIFPDGGAGLEIMNVPDIADGAAHILQSKGLCHISISLGSEDKVDRLTETMRSDGVSIIGNPRTTDDGYYESVIADPEGNVVELTI